MRTLHAARAPEDPLPTRAVSAAVTVREAAQAVADHLAAAGLLPSVYLESGGRLRCEASRGYWQIFDGMPPSSGVIGRTYSSGAEHVVPDVALDPAYLTAVEEVRAEACVPLRARGRVVGVLNIESREVLTPSALDQLRGCARLLERRIEQSPAVTPTRAQRLARCGARLAQLVEPGDVARAAVDSATWVSGLSSAVLLLTDGHGEPHVCASVGPLASVFAELAPDELRSMLGWVELGTSSYTRGEPTGPGFPGHETLRAQGARTLVVLPLESSGRRLGVLALADDESLDLDTDDVELLELLAIQVAAGLRLGTAVSELRERASTDPLTGLGHHATFHGELRQALAEGGRVALVMLDLDGFKALNDSQGHQAGDAVLRACAGLAAEFLPPDARAFRVGGDEFALLFRDGGAVAARRAAAAIRASAPGRIGLTLSMGIAQATPGEAPGELVERADAALYAVKRRGRDGVHVAGRGPVPHPALF